MRDAWKIWLFWAAVILLFFWLAARPSVQDASCSYQWDGQAYVCE